MILREEEKRSDFIALRALLGEFAVDWTGTRSPNVAEMDLLLLSHWPGYEHLPTKALGALEGDSMRICLLSGSFPQ